MANRSEFNRDMGAYLRQRRSSDYNNPLDSARTYVKGFFAKKEEPKEEMPLDIPQEQVEAVIAQSKVKTRSIQKVSVSARPVAQVMQGTPAQEPKQHKVSIMKWFGSKTQEDDYEQVAVAPAQPAIDEDVREVLKITFKWLKMMDQETVEEIKSSTDFEKYKKVLDKYGLIKK